MREIKTSIENILSHVCCAIDYGYYDDVLMSDFATLTGYVTNDEIEVYILKNESDEYSIEDYDQWRERLTDWRNKYCDKDEKCNQNT